MSKTAIKEPTIECCKCLYFHDVGNNVKICHLHQKILDDDAWECDPKRKWNKLAAELKGGKAPQARERKQ
jgi:hypothetical protein